MDNQQGADEAFEWAEFSTTDVVPSLLLPISYQHLLVSDDVLRSNPQDKPLSSFSPSFEATTISSPSSFSSPSSSPSSSSSEILNAQTRSTSQERRSKKKKISSIQEKDGKGKRKRIATPSRLESNRLAAQRLRDKKKELLQSLSLQLEALLQERELQKNQLALASQESLMLAEQCRYYASLVDTTTLSSLLFPVSSSSSSSSTIIK
jgi:hypothetical protein